MIELSPLEVVALGTTIKEKELNKAKAKIDEGSSHTVDFSIRLKGNIQKGVGTPGGTITVQPTVSLRSYNVFCAILRRLGIGPARLGKALADVPVDAPADEPFNDVFKAEEASRASALPAQSQTVNGRAGSVQSQVTATKLDE